MKAVLVAAVLLAGVLVAWSPSQDWEGKYRPYCLHGRIMAAQPMPAVGQNAVRLTVLAQPVPMESDTIRIPIFPDVTICGMMPIDTLKVEHRS